MFKTTYCANCGDSILYPARSRKPLYCSSHEPRLAMTYRFAAIADAIQSARLALLEAERELGALCQPVTDPSAPF